MSNCDPYSCMQCYSDNCSHCYVKPKENKVTIFICVNCNHGFDIPNEITTTSREYPEARAWTNTTEHCPKCLSQNFQFTPEGEKAAFGESLKGLDQ